MESMPFSVEYENMDVVLEAAAVELSRLSDEMDPAVMSSVCITTKTVHRMTTPPYVMVGNRTRNGISAMALPASFSIRTAALMALRRKIIMHSQMKASTALM